MRKGATLADPIDIETLEDPGPGVHVVVHDDPRRAGRAIAERIGAVLIDVAVMAESAVAHRARLAAHRRVRDQLAEAESGLGGAADRQADETLVAAAADLRSLSRRRRIDDPTAEQIRTMARELVALETVRERTDHALHERYAAELGAPVSTAVVIHPVSLRRAAAAVLAEEAAVADAGQALALLPDERTVTAATAGANPSGDEPPGDGSVLLPVGIICLGVSVVAIVLLLGQPVAVAAIPLLLALLVASRVRTHIKTGPTDAADSTALADHPFGGPAGLEREQERRSDRLRQARDRLTLADRAWRAIAPGDADPHDVDEVIRRNDPQHETADLVAAAPAARAAAAVHRRLRANWRVVWAELGRTAPPPEGAVVELVLADLFETAPDPAEAARRLTEVEAATERLRRGDRALADLGDGGIEEVRAAAPTEDDLDGTPLVLVSPFADLGGSRRDTLRRRLDELPPDLTVVIVVRSADEVPLADDEG